MTARVGISAHRGGAEDAPEGSLAAYRASIALGVDLVEVDVRRLPDGTFICRHDAPPDGVHEGVLVLLADVLGAAAAGGVGAHVDVKESGYEAALVAFVEGFGLLRAYYTTGDETAVRALAAAGGTALLTVGAGLSGLPPWTVLGRILGDLYPYRRILRVGASGAAVQFRFVNPMLRRWLQWHRMALLVYTVDGGGSLWWLLRRPGVTAVVTDRPRRAVGMRGA